MKKKPTHVEMKQFHATMPVMEDGPLAKPTQVPVTILAASLKDARSQAKEIGFTLTKKKS
jgi:hypothetical protein